jgi:hypothetical protein
MDKKLGELLAVPLNSVAWEEGMKTQLNRSRLLEISNTISMRLWSLHYLSCYLPFESYLEEALKNE